MLFPSAQRTLQWVRGKELTRGQRTLMGNKYIVRHGAMRLLGEFEAAEEAEYARGQTVIVRSDRGLEAGEVLWPAVPRMTALLEEATHGQILRAVNAEDQAQLELRRESERQS